MKPVAAFLVILTACSPSAKKEDGKTSVSLLTELQGEWERLTTWPDGNRVVYRPCDADNLSIQVMGDTLLIGWGQDASFGLVRSFSESEMPGIYLVTVYDHDADSTLTYRMMWEDDAHNLAEWWLWDDDESVIVARTAVLGNYAIIEQPCQECWDDCEEEVQEPDETSND